MKILIIGNIGAGKTTLGLRIKDITGYQFIEIDHLREKYLDGTVSGEYFSLHRFLKHAEESENAILEFTGVGCHKYGVKRALELSKDQVLVIVCKIKVFETIYEGIKSKKFNYKSPFEIDIHEHVLFIRNELDIDLSNNFWHSERSNVVEVYMDTLSDIQKNIELIKKKSLLV